MRIDALVYTDILIEHLRHGTLETFLKKYKKNEARLYIPFGVRGEVEESLDDIDEIKSWHNLLKQGLSQGLIVKSSHKYDFERPYKILFSKLNSINPELSPVQRHIVALSLQLGIYIITKNEQINRTINKIKITTHLQKYSIRLISKEKSDSIKNY